MAPSGGVDCTARGYHIVFVFAAAPGFAHNLRVGRARVKAVIERGARLSGVLVVVTLALAGCTLIFGPHAPAPTPAAPTAPTVDDDTHLPWATEEPWFIIVRKGCRTLDVYRYGERTASYPAVFGLGGRGAKLYEGDLRTPLGLYRIVDARPHKRWGYFLLLDYPNVADLQHYWAAMEGGRVPWLGDHYARVGGLVGIHGTDKPEKNRREEDWTFGCISLATADVAQLVRTVPVGMPVLIEE